MKFYIINDIYLSILCLLLIFLIPFYCLPTIVSSEMPIYLILFFSMIFTGILYYPILMLIKINKKYYKKLKEKLCN